MGYKILNKCMNLKVNYNTFRISCIMLILEELLSVYKIGIYSETTDKIIENEYKRKIFRISSLGRLTVCYFLGD